MKFENLNTESLSNNELLEIYLRGQCLTDQLATAKTHP